MSTPNCNILHYFSVICFVKQNKVPVKEKTAIINKSKKCLTNEYKTISYQHAELCSAVIYNGRGEGPL